MKKKLLLALCLVAIATLLFALTANAAEPVQTWDVSATESDNVTAYLYADPNNSDMYTLTISGTGNMENWTSLSSVPWYSSYGSKITSVAIEQGVTSIGRYAFCYCTSLTSIVIPENVTSIGNDAFNGCTSLTSIVIPEGVTSIGSGAFYGCSSLTSIVIPKGVTSIGTWAFSDCSSLTSIVIPEGVTSIGISAFRSCSSLTSIVIPDSMTSIGDGAFEGCSSLTSIVIPKGVTYIGGNAFQYCSSLTSIVIPKGVTSIGDYAFYKCSKLTIYCEAPSQPRGWDSYWNYSGCPVVWGHSHAYENHECVCGMAEPYVEKWDISYSSSDNVTAYLYADPNSSGKYTLTFSGTGNMMNWTSYPYAPWRSSYSSKITSVTIEEGVTSIGEYAFYSCDSLTSIVIPEGVSSIGNSAFEYCSKLTSIVIPEGVTSIGDSAFYECWNLISIVIPEGVTYIGSYAFWGCYSLTSIVIPESVTYIGSYAFAYCDSFTSIVIPEGVSFIGERAFYSYNSFTICCEAESQPSGWDSDWNYTDRPVVWGYFDENACLSDIFTFKGYSFSANGGFAVGFAIDYDALAKYEAKTGKTLEIGVVFAGYENLGGKQPLDQNGEAISLQVGKVVKADITEYGYKYYDFMLTGFDDSIKDIKLVIAGYIFDGEAVKYVQANGMSNTVNGITYNEALNG